MLDDLNKINNSDVIKNIFILSAESKISTVYILMNDDSVEKFEKPSDMEYEDFITLIKSFLKNVGMSNSNKCDKWYVTSRKNNWGIDYDNLDKLYDSQHRKEGTEEYKILKIDKYREEIDDYDDLEERYKSKFILDLVSIGTLTLATVYSYKKDGYLANNSNITFGLYTFFIAAALFNKLLVGLSKSALKEIKYEKKKLEKAI